MLSQNSLDELAQPIVERQQSINTYVLTMIAKRVKQIGGMLPSDMHKLDFLLQTGSDIKMINDTITKMTQLQVQDIKNMIKEVAQDVYSGLEPFYNYREISYIPFEENEQLQKVVQAISNQTEETYKNLSKAQAFMIRDLQNPTVLKSTPISETYQTIVDEAVQAASTGVLNYNTAMRRSMEQLVNSGIRYVTYQAESGRIHTQRLDTAVRRNVLDGIRAINQGVQDITGQQFGADGKEITVHQNPAPDHAPVQGHQFSNSEFEKMQCGESCKDVQGRTYVGFDRAIGTLNCRHFTVSIIIGYSNQTYSDEQLNKILSDNQKGYTLPNGKHLTMYECTQKQRDYELKIRHAREGLQAAETLGDEVLQEKYKAKIVKYTQEYKQFSNACGLKTRLDKTVLSINPTVEKFAEESKPKVENPDTVVDMNTINSSQFRRNIDELGETTEISREIYQQSKNILKHRSGTEYEDLVFIDTVKNRSMVRTDYNVKKQCIPSKKMIKMVTNSEQYTIVAIHNHPNSSVPSISDINSAWKKKYKYGIIACHNGNIYKYRVLGEYDQYRVDFLLDKLNSNIYNGDVVNKKDEINKILETLRKENIEMEVFLWK